MAQMRVFGMRLQHEIVGDDSSLRYHDDAIADEDGISIIMDVIGLVDKLNAISNADVFVDDGFFDEAIFTYTWRREARCCGRDGLREEKRVIPHKVRIADDRPLFDDRPLANDAVGDLICFDNRSFAHR